MITRITHIYFNYWKVIECRWFLSNLNRPLQTLHALSDEVKRILVILNYGRRNTQLILEVYMSFLWTQRSQFVLLNCYSICYHA